MAEVTVTGRPLLLMVDLAGHEGISLTASELARASVQSRQGSRFMNWQGEQLEARRFVAPDVVIGGLKLGDIEGGESVFGRSTPPVLTGYVGMPILGHYLVVLDYPSQMVRLYASGDSHALRAECGTGIFEVRLVDGAASSTAMTEYGELDFVWDTATTHNFLRPLAISGHERLAIQVDDGPPELTLSKLVLGGHDVGPQHFRLVPFQEPAVGGYLGAGLMSSHRVCLDIPRRLGAIL